MPAVRKETPSYLKHSTGRARAVWTDPAGKRHDRLLPGPFGSKESKDAFARLILEMQPGYVPPAARADLSVNELLEAHLAHATEHYRRADGTLTSEVNEYKRTGRVVRELYGEIGVGEFGPLALKTAGRSCEGR